VDSIPRELRTGRALLSRNVVYLLVVIISVRG
jgi:hypothetical protein